MNEYIYMLKVSRPDMLSAGMTEAEAEVRGRHVAYVQGLLDSGALILAGRTQIMDERSVGLVIFRAADDDAAQRVMNADPAVAEGLMQAELYPYKVAFAGSFTYSAG